jgi:hypothetical protein
MSRPWVSVWVSIHLRPGMSAYGLRYLQKEATQAHVD